jgi:hypothetical protein
MMALSAMSGPIDTPWEALQHLPKHHVYTVLNQNGTCVTGAFVSVSEKEFILRRDDQTEQHLHRPDIVRISAGETADVHTTVFSGRSSWFDLQALHAPPYYSELLIITTDDRQFRGPLLGASSDQLTLFVDHKEEMRFAKSYVSRVLLTDLKPEQPGVHRNVLALTKRVVSPSMQPVPLYEGNQREDDSPIGCLPTYRRQ